MVFLFFLQKCLTNEAVDCIYGIYTVMTQKVPKLSRGQLRWMEIRETVDKELNMKRQKGYATIKILLFIIALILTVLFFLA